MFYILSIFGMVTILTAIPVAYLIGGIPFGLLVARLFGVRDIREVGSGNIGATNVLRTLGIRVAIWVYLLDIGKGALVVLGVRIFSQGTSHTDLLLVTVGLAAIAGHIFPVYLRFRGGKGVATGFGVLLILMPVEALIAAGVFLIVALSTRYISVASMSAALSLPVAITIERTLLEQEISQVFWMLSVAIGVLVPVTHYQNIRRLWLGTENRFSMVRGKDGAGE